MASPDFRVEGQERACKLSAVATSNHIIIQIYVICKNVRRGKTDRSWGMAPFRPLATPLCAKSHKRTVVSDWRRARLYRCEYQRLIGKCDVVLVNMYTTVKSAKQRPKPTHESNSFHVNLCYHTVSLSLTLT